MLARLGFIDWFAVYSVCLILRRRIVDVSIRLVGTELLFWNLSILLVLGRLNVRSAWWFLYYLRTLASYHAVLLAVICVRVSIFKILN